MVARGAASLDPAALGSSVLVIAPHPDDESIGCGGLIARLARSGVHSSVVIVTDGSASHPCSQTYPPERMAQLRTEEAMQALAILGVGKDQIWFGRLKDRFVPTPSSEAFNDAVEAAVALLTRRRPETLVIPSSKDAHGDHQAVGAIWRQAAQQLPATPPRVLEYIIWPTVPADEAKPGLLLDIAETLSLKCQAIAAHRSQHGLVVTDDPTGFVIPATLLAMAHRPYEIFYEVTL